MAEEGADLLVTPQIKLHGRNSEENYVEEKDYLNGNGSSSHRHKLSGGSPYHGDSSGRSSSERLSFPRNSQDVASRYLRASTGSCHDFCKYGRKQTNEEKPWRSSTKRIAKASSGDQVSKAPPKSHERKKVTVEKHRSPQETKTREEDNKTVSPPEIIKQEVSLPPKEVEVSSKELATGKNMARTEKRIEKMSNKHSPLVEPKAVLMKPSPSSDTSEGKLVSGRRIREIRPGKSAVAPRPSPSSGHSQGKLGRSKINNEVKDGKSAVPSKPSPISSGSQGKLERSIRDNGIKDRAVVIPKAYVNKVLGRLNNSSSFPPSIRKITGSKSRKTRNLKLVPPPKDQNRKQTVATTEPMNENISIKTLHVVEIETRKDHSEPMQKRDVAASLQSTLLPNSLSDPLSSHEDDQVDEKKVESKQHDWEGVEEEEDGEGVEDSGHMDDEATEPFMINKDVPKQSGKEVSEGNHTKTLKKSGALNSKDRDSLLMKLKFRRGKVVELQSDKYSPRRLRFRRGRVLLGNQDGRADVKKNFKKNVVDVKDGANPSSKKVVLRHQGVQDKKDTQGLFNNVIEEAASKLVESRKSKVKALVGAFETVISLQETKPSSNAVS